MCDALDYLDAEMNRWKESAIMDENESILYGAFKKLRSARFQDCPNPKLDKLFEMIIKAYKGNFENSRGIVFVKTRNLAEAILSWMKESPYLRDLNPIVFVGTNMAADKRGMTTAGQVDVLEYFRNVKHKLIIATSVAEEVIDISMCNFVIRYDHVTNKIAMVQRRVEEVPPPEPDSEPPAEPPSYSEVKESDEEAQETHPESDRLPTPEPVPVVAETPSHNYHPRVCHIRKWPDFQGYGFNLHAVKDGTGQFIGLVDANSPAESADLRQGDRIIEINGENVEDETHQKVIHKIKAGDNETKMLVVDAEADEYYKNNGIQITSDLPEVIFKETSRKEISVPEELLNPRDVDMYLKAIEEGKERDKHVRVMVVGHFAQGKTSVTRRILGQSLKGVESTNGIEIHSKQCNKNGTQWKNKPSVEHVDDMTSRLVNVASKLLNTDEQQIGDTTDVPYESNGPVEHSNEPVAENSSTNSSKSKYDASSLEPKYDPNAVESKYDEDLVAQFALKKNASKTCSSAVMEQDDAIDINIWDFGGQFVYYATHQIFHSKNAIYLLVFNLKKPFESMLIDEDFPNNKYTMKSCLAFWMESVHSFVGSNDGKEPTVILVGTHKEDCDGKEKEQLEAAMDIACATGTINHIYETQFAVECMDPHDKSLELLKSDIYKLGQEKTQHRMIPAKWIPLEKKLLEIKNKKIVRLVDVLKIDSKNSHPIQDEEQIKLFLKYHHEKGSLVFFDEEKLQEFVVLDPQFLIDAFKCIITSQRFYRWRPNLKDLGEKLMTSGMLEMDLLNEIWGNDETKRFYAFKNVILAFMQRLRILAEMKDVTDTSIAEHVERCFLVPSLLKGQSDEKVMDAFLSPCKKKSNISLILKLENTSVLPLVYQRVMAAVLAKWSPVYYPKRDPLLFRDIGVFLLDYQHAGVITVHSGGLEMTVVNLCPTSLAEAAVCDQFRRYIEMAILLEFERFSISSEKDLYEYYLRCNHSEHGCKGSINVHDLKKVMGYQEVYCPDHGHHVVDMRESMDQWFKKDTLLPDDDIPDLELTDKALSKIAQAIGKNWKLLGIALGLGQDDVDRCEIDNLTSGVKTTIYYILKEWRTRYPEQNSMTFLIRQMKECEGLIVNWDKINNIIDNF
ncbi:uncharacterized protein LOC123529642 isoform X2 [Mercenaria mercenaria]|nr:uncharacterized protein LOC123529642 isoform X2 [Mercenaria mercenaria]